MAKRKNSDKGKKATSVTPQGYGDTEFAQEPKTKLEEALRRKTRNRFSHFTLNTIG